MYHVSCEKKVLDRILMTMSLPANKSRIRIFRVNILVLYVLIVCTGLSKWTINLNAIFTLFILLNRFKPRPDFLYPSLFCEIVSKSIIKLFSVIEKKNIFNSICRTSSWELISIYFQYFVWFSSKQTNQKERKILTQIRPTHFRKLLQTSAM